ncbi:RDD family protein [Desertivirga arenae]|uniref:RDD family protein n=1 Tax=Desertivirga arenae TaxID=2810309 RepID=UPI001A95B3D2|nr:RDD family protein [Pedobacter sp. SYSU D00823]
MEEEYEYKPQSSITDFPSNKYHIGRRRVLATLLDSMMLLAPLVAITANAAHFENFTVFTIVALIYPWFQISYFVFSHYRSGQTFAKATLNIRLVDISESGGITLKQALLRECVWIAIEVFALMAYLIRTINSASELPWLDMIESVGSSFATIWFILEVVTVLTNKNRRSIGDYIAGTIVIRTE